MAMYEPNGTDEFDDIKCDLDEDQSEANSKEGLRADSNKDGTPSEQLDVGRFVAKLTAIAVVLAIGVTGCYGLFTGDFVPISTVWDTTAAPVGAALVFLTKKM